MKEECVLNASGVAGQRSCECCVPFLKTIKDERAVLREQGLG